jgi:hypothetical protein
MADIFGIVKVNFKVALLDALEFDYFCPEYDVVEEQVDKLMDERLKKMGDREVQKFALALIDGEEVMFDREKDDFYLLSR